MCMPIYSSLRLISNHRYLYIQWWIQVFFYDDGAKVITMRKNVIVMNNNWGKKEKKEISII